MKFTVIVEGGNALSVGFQAALHSIGSGVALALGAVTVFPQTFTFSDVKHLLMVAAGGAVVGLIGYLRQSPLQSAPVGNSQAPNEH